MSRDSTRLDSAVRHAAKHLPVGWQITIELERDSGVVELYDAYGGEHEFPSNQECMADTIRDAVEYAIEEDQQDHERDWFG